MSYPKNPTATDQRRNRLGDIRQQRMFDSYGQLIGMVVIGDAKAFTKIMNGLSVEKQCEFLFAEYKAGWAVCSHECDTGR